MARLWLAPTLVVVALPLASAQTGSTAPSRSLEHNSTCRRNGRRTRLTGNSVPPGSAGCGTKEFHSNSKRTSLTRLSMGEYGAWTLAARNSDRFSSLVIVCGGIVWPPNATRKPIPPGADNPYARTAKAVEHTPIWLFSRLPLWLLPTG